jgi:carbon-monoxide dehydrogenase small subunit
MVIAATGLLLDEPSPDDATIREGIEGNLCRCTGYDMIVDSVRWAAEHGGAGAAAERHAHGGSVPVADTGPAPHGSPPQPAVTP